MSRRPAPRARPALRRRGTLAIIAALLIGSAVMRLATEAGQAIARTPDAAEAAAPLSCEPSPDVAQVLEALSEREARLAARERDIEARMQALSVADREIGARMAELVAAEEALRATIALAERAAEEDLDRLTAVYETMKPKEAVPLFEAMAPDFAAGFLGRMRPEAAAGILAGMTPDAAYAVSVLLAGRNVDTPRE